MSIKLLFTKITNHIFLTYELIIGNRRLIIPTMIGLIIALTVISQSGVLIESYRQEIFEELVIEELENNYYKYGESDINIDMWRWEYSQSGESHNITEFKYYNTLINQSIDQVNYSNYISDQFWSSRLDTFIWLNNTEEYLDKGIHTEQIPLYVSSSPDFYSALENILSLTGNGRLPNNSSEIVLIRPKRDPKDEYYEMEYKRYENVTLGAKVNITLNPDYREGGLNKTVKIVGLMEHSLNYDDYTDNGTSLLREYFMWLWGYFFITQPNFLDQTFKDLSNPFADPNMDTRGKIYLDKTRFDAYNINIEINKLQDFIRALEWQFQSYSPWLYSRLLEKMRAYETSIFSLLITMMLLSSPVLCIALYLVVYSFGLIRKQKQEQIGIIKTRGGSWLQTLIILLGEMIISTILAVFIGFLLSTFLADIVLRSTNYLEFLGVQTPVQITIGMIQALFLWGIFFALILNLRNIIRMSRQDISETLEPTETQNPVWKRYYLDIIIFVIGTAAWVILMTLIRSGGEIVTPEFYIIYILISLLGIPAPFLMFFGTIMVIARFFPYIMKKIAEILWRLEGGINAFSIRNIVRHKQAANRAVLLITLALSFSILSSSLIFSVDETERLKSYYDVGADLSISMGVSLNTTVLKNLEQNVSHLKSISGVYSTYHYSSGDYSPTRSYQFMFVDPSTYANTAFENPSFKLSSSLPSLMEQLEDNNTVILYKGNLEADLSKPKIGDNIELQFSNDTHSEQLSFRVGGTFKYWPTMFPYEWEDPAYNFWGIGSLGMFEKLNRLNYFSSIEATYQAKIDSLNNIEKTVERIYNVTGITPSSPALSYKEYKTSFERRFTLSILNSDLVVCFAVAVIGVIMFAFFTYVERGKEIGVERALGMTQFQTAQSFLVEAATILSFGCIIGYITGVYFVTMFLQIIQLGESIPPLAVTYPTAFLIQILLGIIISAGIGTIIPAYIATRKDISRILKVE
ncbi:MAG: FtsX-like permease family protein [Promethearchaeota archaeon]